MAELIQTVTANITVRVTTPDKKKILTFPDKIAGNMSGKTTVSLQFDKRQWIWVGLKTEALFQYPETDEFDTVPFSYITEYLDAPKVNSRHHLVFSNVKHPVFR